MDMDWEEYDLRGAASRRLPEPAGQLIQPAMRDFLTDERKEKIRGVLSRRQKDLTLIVDNVWDPHNVSAILRSCDAFGVGLVHLYYTVEAFPDIGKKSSASAKKWVRRQRWSDAEAMAERLHGDGYQILATSFGPHAKPLTDWDYTRPTAVVVSNEHDGLKPELAQVADGEVYIPMQGMIPSFNVSVAAALTLYEAWRQRMAKGMYDSPSYSEAELEAMFEDWASR
jgi:tRNA (guanosine-2'-O-)-methyltransferase